MVKDVDGIPESILDGESAHLDITSLGESRIAACIAFKSDEICLPIARY